MLVVLTGAGISKESGLSTFRDQDGLWENERVDDVASPEGFRRNPEKVFSFYHRLYSQLSSPSIAANAAHIALAKLEQQLGDEFLLVTQNVDDLHERAGSKRVLHMHGELSKIRCTRCDTVQEHTELLSQKSVCAHCGSVGTLRPHIVWFGEVPFYMPEIEEALSRCTQFVAIGTSGHVYPAAGFSSFAKSHGARLLELNLEKTQASPFFDEGRYGLASVVVPEWVEEFVSDNKKRD